MPAPLVAPARRRLGPQALVGTMTGPAHFARAEEHLAAAATIETDGDEDSMSAWHQRQALVHATLANAAATALIGEKPRSGSFDAWREWNQVTGGADYPAVTR